MITYIPKGCRLMTGNESVGRRIRQLRKQARMTLKELAGAAGISIGFLGDIESGRSRPSIETLGKLAKALNTTTDCLLGRDYYSRPLDIGPRLREFRLRAGMSGPDLAKASGVASSEIDDIESGRSVPSLTVIDKLCTALGITLAEFFESPAQDEEKHLYLVRETHTRIYDSIMRAKELPDDNLDQIADALEALVEHHERKTKKQE